MARKTCQSSFDPNAGVAADYAVVLTTTGAALIALIYLILI